MSRHKAREAAMQVSFQLDFGKNSLDMARLTLEEVALKKEFSDFAWSLVGGIEANKGVLDEYLVKFTKEWDLDRLANVDKCILRLAMYELMFEKNTPARIVISEAVELAKTFCGVEAPSFVNAVLDGFYHKVVLEDCPDYRIDTTALAASIGQAGLEAQQLLKIAEGQAVLAEEPEKPLAKPLAVPTKKPSVLFENNKKVNEGKAYRIIKKADLAPDDRIHQENVLEDKQRMFGGDAFLTPGDIRKAAEEGVALPRYFPTQAKKDPDESLQKDFKKDAHSQFKKFAPKDQRNKDQRNKDQKSNDDSKDKPWQK